MSASAPTAAWKRSRTTTTSADNVYARHNAWSIAFSYDEESAKFQSYKVYLFTAIPSLSYNIRF